MHNHTKKLTKAQSDAVKAIDIVAKAIGRKVNIIDSAMGEVDGKKITANAFIDKETNEYYVPVHDVGATILYFALHENIHDIAKNNPEGFAFLQNIVFDELIKKGVDIDELFEVQEKLYPNEDANYWGEEIVANTVPVILADKGTRDAFIQRIIGADNDTRTAFEKILDAISSFLKKAYNALKTQQSWQQMAAIEGDMQAIARIRDAYFDALEGIAGVN